jgi:hypothetical protein
MVSEAPYFVLRSNPLGDILHEKKNGIRATIRSPDDRGVYLAVTHDATACATA